MGAIAKITAKGQITIPLEIRTLLGVKAGDHLAWEEAPDGSVRVRRVQPMDLEYLRALEGTLGEWNSQADEEAYAGL